MRYLSISAVLVAACSTHSANLTDVGVTFHGARLNGAPVEVDNITEQGIAFRVEHSVFVAEIVPPFQGFQAVLSVAPSNPETAWQPTSEDAQKLAVGLAGAFQQKLNGYGQSACAEPRAIGPGWELECTLAAKSVTYRMRTRATVGPHGIIALQGTWLSDGGKQWVDAFFQSLHTNGHPSAPVGPPGTSLPIAEVGVRASAALIK
jgi:hypothetical protein